ncbi:MAG: hypothetical protein UX85_C0001G0241 [Candidatus Beckwithbacteria bacterium GW2011_GWB1_47_15]|uniref:SpoVT-AbrB domain-containing protein n=1 Tax=Candidatus Beckwithbacteria bacterium GW2011_GWB1_47_15 TaxID=1618371 RepID=A0A0G1RY43_9BACT|nr:MAG: hypothetical protein UY43_C0001G0884 [Candidatus Beckwithbacteria bacterium GW2011_GWC1_49_16]AQS30879.1 hypothetical protein [uncultured bacterium]KKU36063.1 MAG: hypothetical protein UX50_C0001G0240 [Candidatus Beckwithbacteria bacterium GW2011_GWA1_46_30]KKU62027.1 MAG: hypothetical protein UX85_C0001G0241 [Candidatus Beckwithbacteria bacterium GW2011_GWB1_47_15]KKU72420.1 MAG: hypothetical protein UX97_C0001G0290 [Candidatus Beckwithbacteria bacterium GW2011_GWA2_47_25]OGD49327.1 M
MQKQSLETIVKLQPKGLMTVPKAIRAKYGLEENGLIRIKEDKGRIYLEPVRTLPYPVRSYTDEELKDFFDFDDQLQKGTKSKK